MRLFGLHGGAGRSTDRWTRVHAADEPERHEDPGRNGGLHRGHDSTPYYIFPMYTLADCTTTNVNELMDMLYRPLYWYGNNYSPTVDYGYSIGRRRFSDGDKTVTIHLNPWKWSDGETVTSRDLVFWMNVLESRPGDGVVRLPPGVLPRHRDQLLGAQSEDVRNALEQGL